MTIDPNSITTWLEAAEKAAGLITAIITLAKALRGIARRRKHRKGARRKRVSRRRS